MEKDDRGASGSQRSAEGSSAARFAGVGLQFGVAIIVFLYAGQWLDRRFGTSPLFLILGVFLGGGGAFYSMYRKLMAAQEAEEAQRRANGGGARGTTSGAGRTGRGTPGSSE